MKRLKKILHDMYTLWFQSSYSRAQKWQLFFAYVRITVLNFLNGRTMRVAQVRFLGYEWEVRDIGEFTWLISEVLIDEPYRLPKEIGAGDTIIDGGANIGMSIVYFKLKYPDTKIEAFEPDPDVVAMLKRNLERNNITGVTLHQVALSATETELVFYKRRDISIASSVLPVDPDKADKITVPAKPLSEFITGPVAAMKLDIQFSEATVFAELAQSDVLKHVAYLVLEYHYRFDVKNNQLSTITHELETADFDYTIEQTADKPNRFRTYQIRAEQVTA